MNELSKVDTEIMASLILNGDIGKLNQVQRVQYVTSLCERIGLDPLTQPFKILRLSGREVLYADKGCTQQLCKVYGISTEITKKEKVEDVYVVTVKASDKNGRFTDEDGAVTIGSLKGDMLANALMKAVTKSKRRAVLAFCGLGMLDETEIETIKGAETLDIKTEPVAQPPIKSNDITDAQIAQLKKIAIDKFAGVVAFNTWLKNSYGIQYASFIPKENYEKIKADLTALPNKAVVAERITA